MVSSICRLPVKRADLPRINSKASGFFFCGIKLEPVVNASGKRTKLNSALLHKMKSSDSRERCTPIVAQAEAKLIKVSRSLTASMLFCVILGLPSASTKFNSRATNSRSIGSVVPAIAPEPSGHTFASSNTTAIRLRSRSNISTYASKWCAIDTGCARCKCV